MPCNFETFWKCYRFLHTQFFLFQGKSRSFSSLLIIHSMMSNDLWRISHYYVLDVLLKLPYKIQEYPFLTPCISLCLSYSFVNIPSTYSHILEQSCFNVSLLSEPLNENSIAWWLKNGWIKAGQCVDTLGFHYLENCKFIFGNTSELEWGKGTHKWKLRSLAHIPSVWIFGVFLGGLLPDPWNSASVLSFSCNYPIIIILCSHWQPVYNGMKGPCSITSFCSVEDLSWVITGLRPLMF